MQNKLRAHLLGTALILGALGFAGAPASAAIHLDGQVQAGGGPVAQSTVTLWAASANAPMQLGQAKTGTDGHFAISVDQSAGSDAILYLIASGGTPAVNQAGGNNPTLDLLAVLGGTPPASVVVNELTTVASAFTAARFINGESISGNPLGLRIAAGNVPNLVDPGDRRMGQGAARSAQQLDDHDDGEPGHARLAHHRLLHRGQRRLARPFPQGRDTDRRSGTKEHARSDGRHRPRSRGPHPEGTLRAVRRSLSAAGTRRAAQGTLRAVSRLRPGRLRPLTVRSRAAATTPTGVSCSTRTAISGAARTGCPARSPASTRASAAA